MEPIILLHGALGSAQSMLSLSKLLDPYLEVHIMDFPGHGEARWPEEGFSMETFEQAVLRLMDKRNLQTAGIFGYSMGGFVGLRLAMAAPERISSIVTLATRLDWTEEACAKESQMLDADALEAKVPKFTAGLAKIHTRAGWRMVLEESRELLQGMSRYRFTDEDFGRIGTPVRLMLGDRDKMVRMDETVHARHALPNAELAILPGTPHPLEMVNKDLLAMLIRTAIPGK